MERSELLNELASRIVAVETAHPTRVGIDGVDAAGKTTLANELVPFIEDRGRPVIRASIDGFHNPAAVRYQRGRDSPEGYYHDSFNYDAITSQLLIRLGPDGTLRYRTAVFDYRTDSPVHIEIATAAADAVLLFDGVFLLTPELKQYWDFTIFVDADFAVTVPRAVERSSHLPADLIRTQYERRYIPGQRLYLQQCRPQQNVTVVVDNNDLSNPLLK